MFACAEYLWAKAARGEQIILHVGQLSLKHYLASLCWPVPLSLRSSSRTSISPISELGLVSHSNSQSDVESEMLNLAS